MAKKGSAYIPGFSGRTVGNMIKKSSGGNKGAPSAPPKSKKK